MPVEAVDYLTVGDGELIIKVAGVALNPIGWMTQALGDHLFNWLQYPFILGSTLPAPSSNLARASFPSPQATAYSPWLQASLRARVRSGSISSS